YEVNEYGLTFKKDLISDMIMDIFKEYKFSSTFSTSSAFGTSFENQSTTSTSPPDNTQNPDNPEDYFTEEEENVLTAIIEANPSSGITPLLVNFNGSSSFAPPGFTIESYSWDFDASNGIQTDATGETASFTYNVSGVYTVTLTITDNAGNTATDTIEIDTTGGAHFYVDDDAPDNSGEGTQSDPWQSITYAMSQCDGVTPITIHVADGNYDTTIETFPINCVDQVTVLGESTAGTVVDGDGGGASQVLFDLNNLNDFTFDTLTFEQTQFPIDATNSTLVLDNCTFQNYSNQAVIEEAAISLDGCDFSITNSLFDNFFHGIISTSAVIQNTVVIDNCEFANMPGDDIKIEENFAAQVTITESIFHDDWNIELYGLTWANSLIVNIDKCTFYGAVANFEDGIETRNITGTITNCLFYNITADTVVNIWDCYNGVDIYNCTFDNIRDNALPGSVNCVKFTNEPGCSIRNCSITNSDGYGIYFDSVAGSVDLTNTTVENNLIFNHGVQIARENWSGTDYPTAAAVNIAGGIGNIEVNPNYKSTVIGSEDYRPQPPPAVGLRDAGTGNGSPPTDDLNNNPRPLGGGYDIGAYEYQEDLDPVISGTIYNSITNEPIYDAIIGIYKKGSSSPLQTSRAGNFSFNVLPGYYYFAVKKNGFHFPAQNATKSSKGEVFQVYGGINQQINIPLDPKAFLELNKTANKNQLIIGEIVTVNCEIKNNYLFNSIHDVLLVDQIPRGFKYVPDSLLVNNKKIQNPSIINKYLKYPLGTIQSRKTVNISYQMVVTAGATFGKFSSIGICKQNNLEISEPDYLYFKVIPDTLFTKGTVIGKTIPNATILTEYGVKIKADKNGLFHIPNIHPGRHILKIGNKTILFEIREGEIKHIKIPQSAVSHQPSSNLNIVALGEVTFSDNDDLKDERGAIYIDGETKGGIKIAASLDTQRLDDDYKDLRKKKYYTRFQPENYFPEFGDSSIVDHSSEETLDAISLKIEKKDSYFKWGSFEIDYPYYRRIFHGAKIHYQNQQKTVFETYYATKSTEVAYEEQSGTNGSVYYLKHGDIIEGSENLKIQEKEPITQRILYEIELQSTDYSINYSKGRI
ncbi:hypothetical protein BVX93_01470, partial [bacterium B13(2017)]